MNDWTIVKDLSYNEHIKPVLKQIKKWNKKLNIRNITKYSDYTEGFYGLYKGKTISDLIALAVIAIREDDKEIFLQELASGEKGAGKYLLNSLLQYFKQNKHGCKTFAWTADPDASDDLKNYYKKNWPEAKETEEKNEYWSATKFTINL